MQAGDDILKLLKEKGAEATRQSQCGLLLQPGAIGDCILTLPLVKFMKEKLGLVSVEILGHTEYIGILPGRSCADGVRSMDSVDLHRLFVPAQTFELPDYDPLINLFAHYTWIVTFLGEPGSSFEQNLIFTINCSHSAEVITLPLKPARENRTHIAEHYIRCFIAESNLSLEHQTISTDEVLIRATTADRARGKEVLEETGVETTETIIVIHPGSGSQEKCWCVDNFLTVAKELTRAGFEVVFLLGPAELDRFSNTTLQRITAAAKCLTNLSLTEVLGILSCADRFLGNDSGITHLAAGLGLSTVAVFGPTDPNIYRPIGPDVTVLRSSEPNFNDKPSDELQRQLLEALIT